MLERLGFDATVCIRPTTATSLCRIAIEKLNCVSKNADLLSMQKF